MTSKFCSQCGAKLLSDAHFCAQCGQPVHATARVRQRTLRLDRVAPVAVVGTVLGIAGLAVLVGSRSAAPPNVPPPPAARAGGATMPEGHPPVKIPDDVRDVITRLAEAAKSKPDDLDTWQQLGFVQYRAGQIEPRYLADAEATYRHILDRQPENLDALRALGNIAYDHEQPQLALDLYQRYLKIKPDDLSVQTDLGTMQLAMQQVDAALQTYQNVLRVDPNQFQAQFNLAIAYRAAGDTEKALAALERARGLAPDDATRERVAALLARVTGAPGSAPAGQAAAGGDLHGEVETIFRAHPIVGPKLDRIEWPEAQRARVLLREFPMETMPPFVRDKFLDRIRTGVRESKGRHQVTSAVQVELVDAATGTVMETVSE